MRRRWIAYCICIALCVTAGGDRRPARAQQPGGPFRPGNSVPGSLPPTVPQKGPAWTPNSIAFIDSQGLLDGLTGTAANCVHVDGSSAPCASGGGGSGPSFSDAETPGGTINGSNTVFTLANAPSPAASLILILDGVVETQGSDYSISGASVTFINGVVPQTGDTLRGWYRY